jgi:hypothetical protein
MEKQSTKINKKDFIEKFGKNAVYAVGNFETRRKGHYFPSFYLHADAENRNGYDICNASTELISRSLRQGANLCVVHFRNGNKVPAICFSKFVFNQMKGLICLLSDKLGIYNAVHEYFKYSDTPLMDSFEEDYLRKHEIFKFIRKYEKDDKRYLEVLEEVRKTLDEEGDIWSIQRIDEMIESSRKAIEENEARYKKIAAILIAKRAAKNQ